MKNLNLTGAIGARGWTYTETAVKAEVSPSALYFLIHGKRKPSESTAQKLAEVLGVEVDQIFPDIYVPGEQSKKAGE